MEKTIILCRKKDNDDDYFVFARNEIPSNFVAVLKYTFTEYTKKDCCATCGNPIYPNDSTYPEIYGNSHLSCWCKKFNLI